MSETPLFTLTDAQVLAGQSPFPDAIEFAHDLVFHGTTGSFEESIDKDGLIYQPSGYSRSDLEFLLETFKRVWWSGRHPGGFSVLETFSRSDFELAGGNAEKPIYFGETGQRATLYATRDYAGGETARAIPYSVHDLLCYAHDDAYRQEELLRSWKGARGMYRLPLTSELETRTRSGVSLDDLRQFWMLLENRFPNRGEFPLNRLRTA